jgi:hypothetical protein
MHLDTTTGFRIRADNECIAVGRSALQQLVDSLQSGPPFKHRELHVDKLLSHMQDITHEEYMGLLGFCVGIDESAGEFTVSPEAALFLRTHDTSNFIADLICVLNNLALHSPERIQLGKQIHKLLLAIGQPDSAKLLENRGMQ